MFPSSTTETKIAVLEERLSVYEQMMEKINFAIQKISDTSQNISKMLAVHNERLEQCNKTDNVIISMIEDIKTTSNRHYEEISKELGERLDEVEKKVDDASRIKWIAVGMGIVVSVLVASFSSLASGWWTPSEMQMQHEGHTHQQTVPSDN